MAETRGREAWEALGKRIETLRPDIALMALAAYERAKQLDQERRDRG